MIRVRKSAIYVTWEMVWVGTGVGGMGMGRAAGVTYGISLCLCTSIAHQTEGSATSMLLQD